MTRSQKVISCILVIAAIGIAAFVFFPRSKPDTGPPSRERVKVLLDEMQLKAASNQTLDAMIDVQSKNPQVAMYRPTMRRFLQKYMSWSTIKEQITTIYCEEFTAAQVEAAIAFYQTPEGRAFASKQSVLQSRTSKLGQQRVQDHMPELFEMIRRDIEKGRKQSPQK